MAKVNKEDCCSLLLTLPRYFYFILFFFQYESQGKFWRVFIQFSSSVLIVLILFFVRCDGQELIFFRNLFSIFYWSYIVLFYSLDLTNIGYFIGYLLSLSYDLIFFFSFECDGNGKLLSFLVTFFLVSLHFSFYFSMNFTENEL